MKKVLFFALAALAYSGSASAQTTATWSTALPTIPTGDAIYDATAANILTGGSATTGTFFATKGGTYNFLGKGTDWTTYAAGISKSTLTYAFVGTDLTTTTTPLSKDITAADWASSANNRFSIDVTVKSSATSGSAVTFKETVTDNSSTPVVSDCGDLLTFNVYPVEVPNISSITVDKTTVCANTYASDDPKLTLTWGGSYDPSKTPTDGTVTGISPSLWVQFDITKNGSAITGGKPYVKITGNTTTEDKLISLDESLFKNVGVYTFKAVHVWDTYSYYANNSTAINSTVPATTITIAVLPKPTPTLQRYAYPN